MIKHSVTQLKSGLTVVRLPMPSTESVTVLALANTGSRYETPELQGIAHFLEHMVFKGTAKYATPQILAATVDGVGADFNAFTSKEYTGYYVHAAAQHFGLALDVVSDMLLTPKLAQTDIDREKGVIVEELNMYVDSPQRHIDNVFDQLMFGDPGLGHDIVGTPETIRSFTSADFSRFLHHWYGLNNLVLVVAGDATVVNSESFLSQVETAFGKQPSTERSAAKEVSRHLPPKVIGETKLKVVYRKTQQAHFVLGWPGLNRSHPDRYALAVLSTILGGNMSSRLFTEVREKRGLCYYVHSSEEYFHDVGVFGGAAGVDPGRIEEAIHVTIGEFLDLANGKQPVTEQELQRAKDYWMGKTVLGLEDSESVAQYFGLRQLLRGKIETVAETMAKIKAVNLDDLHRIAKQIIKLDQLRFAVIGPFKSQAKVAGWVAAALAQKPVKSATKKSSKK
jgi:predicted Zn-dependent peptidase